MIEKSDLHSSIVLTDKTIILAKTDLIELGRIFKNSCSN